MERVKENCDTNTIKVLVGNKKDLEKERKVLNETAYDYAKEDENFRMYFETSALNDPQSIKSLFAYLGEELAKHPDVGVSTNIRL